MSELLGFQADTEFGFYDRTVESHKERHPQLISNAVGATMLGALKHELGRSKSFTFSVAFITPGGLAGLKQALLDFPGRGTIITSTYLDFNAPAVFRELLALENVDVFISPLDVDSGFHPKGYVFAQDLGTTAIVGSSNLTRNALLKNTEWNLRFSAMPDGDIVRQVEEAIERQTAGATPLTNEWIEDYEARRLVILPAAVREEGPEQILSEGPIVPNAMQEQALENLALLHEEGAKRAVIVSATGTGKTILAALAVKAAAPERVLFVVHREQILDKAKEEFLRVLDAQPEDFGKIGGGSWEPDKKFVFATVQSLSTPANLQRLAPETFDYILIDEVHRAGAAGYLKLIDYFTPQFLLGLTATPERTDDFNIYELFDYNVPFEVRLQDALEQKMLVPFAYYGVSDYTDAAGNTTDDTTKLNKLVSPERVNYVLRMMELYGHADNVKGLIFCSRNEEARELVDHMTGRLVHGRPLRLKALSGADTQETRTSVIKELDAGALDYIVTVDIFNEGIDIPQVNQVVMLRGTQSSIIFTQQLGRGLRKAPGKDHLRVIDFIGNYKNNFLIPIALYGDNSLNKDHIKKHILEGEVLSGLSSVSFDKVAKERVLDSLNQVKLDSLPNLSKSLRDMRDRVGRTPRLFDFAYYDAADPVVLGNREIPTPHGSTCNFWTLLHKAKLVDRAPSELQAKMLKFFSVELLSGKRPHELLLVQALLHTEREFFTESELPEFFGSHGTRSDAETIGAALRMLTMQFSTSSERAGYGDLPVLVHEGDRYSLAPAFSEMFHEDPMFAGHVDDVIETGLHLARHRYNWGGGLVVGQKYSRKDACRLLNWKSNSSGAIFGYHVDLYTNTCPIFVTYHKADDVSESTRYEDAFDDTRTMQWFTRSGLTVDSKEVQQIMGHKGPMELNLFVKKDDAERGQFFYLGTVKPRDAVNDVMASKEGEKISVVTMKLDLDTPIDPQLFDYFEAKA